MLIAMWGVLSVVMTTVNGLALTEAEWTEGIRTGVALADLGLITYLCFWNSWFRNEVVRLSRPKVLTVLAISRNSLASCGKKRPARRSLAPVMPAPDW